MTKKKPLINTIEILFWVLYFQSWIIRNICVFGYFPILATLVLETKKNSRSERSFKKFEVDVKVKGLNGT